MEILCSVSIACHLKISNNSLQLTCDSYDVFLKAMDEGHIKAEDCNFCKQRIHSAHTIRRKFQIRS